jgi:hypothetical protein
MITRSSSRTLPWRVRALVFTVGAVLFIMLAASLDVIGRIYIIADSVSEVPLDSRVNATLAAMEESSREATVLLAELQRQTISQATVEQLRIRLNELQKQRNLLEVATEQRQAIQPPNDQSVTDIFSSLNFWLTSVLPNVVTFIGGVLVTLYLRRVDRRV